MGGLYEKQADMYLDARPTYPSEWYNMLAECSLHHSLAWDVATGNGQAAIGIAEHYEQVIGTDISEAQVKHAMPHPRVRYIHTSESLSDDELVTLIGVQPGSVDLITLAQAVHWFDLTRFYSIATRLLKKSGGIIAVWGYRHAQVNQTVDIVQKSWLDSIQPYWHPKIQRMADDYKTLPFPFESVGLSSDGEPLLLEIEKQVSFEVYLKMLRSYSSVASAKEKGVDLLPREVVRVMEAAWGGIELVRTVVYKAYMLVGKVKQ